MRQVATLIVLLPALAGCMTLGTEHTCHVSGHHLAWVQPDLVPVVQTWPDDANVTRREPVLASLPLDERTAALLPGGNGTRLITLSSWPEHGSVTLEGFRGEPVFFLHWNGRDRRELVRAEAKAFIDEVSLAPQPERDAALDELMAGWDERHAALATAPGPFDLGPFLQHLNWTPRRPGHWIADAGPIHAMADTTVWRFGAEHADGAVHIDAAGAVAGPRDGRPEQEADLEVLEAVTRARFQAWGLPEPDLSAAEVREDHDWCS